MPSRRFRSDEHGLLGHPSFGYRGSIDLHETDLEYDSSLAPSYTWQPPSLMTRLFSFIFHPRRSLFAFNSKNSVAWKPRRHRRCRVPSPFRRIFALLYRLSVLILFLFVFTGLFRPSYTRRPAHYNALRDLALGSNNPGRGNPHNEKIFIGASIFDPDGSLVSGQWGKNVLQLIDLLGPENTYFSIYENDAGDEAPPALKHFEEEIPCNRTVLYERHLDVGHLSHVTLPDGSERVKRIAFLAAARNRALIPLDSNMDERYDKILYLNDVYFDPIDAIQLLFATNIDEKGTAQYRAACSIDFINPFKFYDTFASRDLEGYSMGVPFFPWFTNSGQGDSRRDVLNQRDAVRVRSCWGGMVAFDAQYFQPSSSGNQLARFRAEPGMYWDASECCLIHADIQAKEPTDTEIYVNPYIRVAYHPRTLSWLKFTRRFERLYSIIHNILNHLVGLPWHNPRRAMQAGDPIRETVWVDNGTTGGSYHTIDRLARPGGFCGRQALQVMKSNPKQGEKNWEMIRIPQD